MLIISVESQFLEDGQIVTKSDSLKIWDNPSEVTMRQWADMELVLATAPDWFQDIMKPKTDAALSENESSSVESWDEVRWLEYRNLLISVIEVFVENKDCLHDLKNLPLFDQNGNDSLANISALFRIIIANLYNYRGKPMQIFQHKGLSFSVPNTMLDAAGKVRTIAESITFQEATEALQADAKFSRVDFEGKAFYKDAKYQTSLWILACICREFRTNEFNKVNYREEVPSKTSEWYDLIISRLDFFADVSLETAMNVCFFLSNSKDTSMTTLAINGFLLNQALSKMLVGSR